MAPDHLSPLTELMIKAKYIPPPKKKNIYRILYHTQITAFVHFNTNKMTTEKNKNINTLLQCTLNMTPYTLTLSTAWLILKR